ncbi:protein far1-related sequence 5-like [Gigaspora margarita]|uniref:Protein far1-related sequence 5-like n=1 Tax=Gigaspora margarita TaxID=4874 RepID=A0A8H4A4X2_GIGMA|nr:protein far1-related sequence 5-like [Gigaspora margarita]
MNWYTSSFFEADHTFSALEAKETSSRDVTSSTKKTSTSLDVEITSSSFTCIEFASSISNYKHSEVTSPIYTYQYSEVASFSSNCQDMEISCFDTVNDAFIEDVDDEPQTTLKSLLNGVEFSNIIELWRIRHMGELSHYENIVALLSDRTHLCTLHFSIIPTRWYKDSIVDQLDVNLKNSPVLVAIKPYIETLNQFGVAFSIFKTAINIALETNSNKELIQDLSYNINNSYDNTNEKTNESEEVVLLQQQFINQITDLKVVKIRGALSKKRMKSFTKVLDRRANNQKTSNSEMSSKVQRKYLLYGALGHYQKKYPNKEKNKENMNI